MAGNTKNLGQVSGVHIGNTPPSNIVLIWYDNTPSQKRHKVYDPNLQQWVVLDQNIISAITYSELVNMAKNTGLSVGEWFQITDRSNALALAITSTKVQYSDAIGNILIDDLGTNVQYHVTSSNLSIDDVIGVFDETNKKLVFQFNEQTPDFTADDYVFGKVKRNNIWSLAKYKLSSFLSKVTGNSISWNGGFFFSFSNALKDVSDKKGGVVSKDTYDYDIEQLNIKITNAAKENQKIIQNAQKALEKATSEEAIYGTKLPSLNIVSGPVDVKKGDTLLTIVNKFQSWINKFKYATGIRLPSNFSSTTEGKVSNNDNVSSAISKLQKQITDVPTTFKLGKDFEPYGSNLAKINDGDLFSTAFSKIESDRRKAIDIEHSLSSLYSQNGVSYRYGVSNGTLKVFLWKNSLFTWQYFIGNDEGDYTRFFPIDFNGNDDLVKAIQSGLSIGISGIDSYNAVSLVNAGHASCLIDNNLVLAEVSFGFITSPSFSVGIILRPLVSKDTEDTQEMKIARPGYTSFYSLFFSLPLGEFSFRIPSLFFQYKIW